MTDTKEKGEKGHEERWETYLGARSDVGWGKHPSTYAFSS
jgi:hypothetical protein